MSGTGRPLRVFVLGASGTMGRATVRALLQAGHHVVCALRARPGADLGVLHQAELRICQVTDPVSLAQNGFKDEQFDAVVSCLASRTGVPSDAWAIDYQANHSALNIASDLGVRHFILLSAICVQKPRLGFQQAKLAFEDELARSGLRFSIVRPTAFFKSLSGQIERVRQGKPFLLFGDGQLTACKPISDDDLGRYLAECLVEEDRHNRILPIGGPGPAISPLEQGAFLFELFGQEPKFRHIPPGLLKGISACLRGLGHVSAKMAEKAELAAIGHYYATESMLVWDERRGCYDADATPSFGTQTLFEYYQSVARGEAAVERGDHAVF